VIIALAAVICAIIGV